jgi:hypothetical protein
VTQLGSEPVINLKEAREQYVREQSKEILFEISQKKVPKGVYFSSLVMTFPLAFLTLNLVVFAPFAANPTLINPETFQYMARGALRLL